MITIFLEDTPQLISGLNDAINQDDKALFIRSTHTLKSSSANLGAMRLSEMSKELELVGKNGGLNGIREKTKLVAEEFEKVKGALGKYL